MAFERRNEATITTLSLVVLLGITWWVAIAYLKSLANTTMFESESLFRPSGASAMIGNIDTSSWASYANPTAGFALRYPPDWYVEETSADPATHGDAATGPFEVNITSATGFGISASHVFPSYDGLSKSAQWQNIISAIQPLSGNYHELESRDGAQYMRSFTESASGNGDLVAYLPTGKYTIEIRAVDAANTNDVQTFDAILETLGLK